LIRIDRHRLSSQKNREIQVLKTYSLRLRANGNTTERLFSFCFWIEGRVTSLGGYFVSQRYLAFGCYYARVGMKLGLRSVLFRILLS